MTNDRKTTPSRTTRDEEARDAQVPAGADEVEGPDPTGDAAAGEDVAEHYEDMMERGANQRGEGRIP